MGHRLLTAAEIRRLEEQGCSAEDWSRVRVRDPFDPGRVAASAFSGEVRIGRLTGHLATAGGVVRPCGVYRSRIHDATLGDECVVEGVGALANYDVGDRVLLENVCSLRVTGETGFGNGVEIDVVNEAGGRPLPLCERLSAQLAWLVVFHRHRPDLVERLRAIIHRYAATRRRARGSIGEGAQIRNTGEILDVAVGPYARLEGCARLEEGTVASWHDAPTYVGTGVVAKRFIILTGARVDQGAILEKCLVGQSVKIGKQFSAENSVFFCNSELFHGEACSVFAGPYTVSHHKSSLLIAGAFSFYNAGSGTNQSNHMYKLGPVHQGLLERGCKTGSFSYLFWPSRVGAFSSVIGKHYTHFDTSDLPFSMISEHEGRTVCIPAMNMFTVGTRRDAAKWPARDGRTGQRRIDHLHFEVFSPRTIGSILRGVEKLGALAASAREGQEFLNFNGIAVQKMLVRTAGKYYEMAIRLFIGRCLAARLESLAEATSFAALLAALAADTAPALYPWLDIGGMLVPEPDLATLLDRVLGDEVADVESFEVACTALHADYARKEWAWCAKLIESRAGRPFAELGPAELAALLEQWEDTTIKFNNMIVGDAKKEFEADVMYSYGVDGDAAARQADFAAVRGTFESNGFVKSVREDSERTSARVRELTARIAALARPEQGIPA